MKPLLTLTAGLITGVMFAGGAANAQGARIGAPIYDPDGDGQATLAELQAARTVEFAQIDTSGDELVTLAELQAWLETKASEHYQALDSDGNGSLSAAEFTADRNSRPGGANFHARLFKLADSDSDGALSATEFKAAIGGSDHAIHLYAHLDADDSGTVSSAEYLTIPAGFGRLRGPHPGSR